MLNFYYVLDQNYLRSDELRKLITEENNYNFILTDTAFLEMCKSTEWKETVLRSLKELSACPNRVYVSIGAGEAMRFEIAELRSADGFLLHKNHRKFAREILESIRSGCDSENIRVMASKMPDVRASIKNNELNHAKNKDDINILISSLQKIMKSDFLKRLRSNSIEREEKLLTMAEISPILLEPLFERRGISKEKTKFFLKKSPYILRHNYLRLWLCFDWLSKGGFESLKDHKVTNDLLDHNYIAISTFFDGILTKENRIKEAYSDIKWMLANNR